MDPLWQVNNIGAIVAFKNSFNSVVEYTTSSLYIPLAYVLRSLLVVLILITIYSFVGYFSILFSNIGFSKLLEDATDMPEKTQKRLRKIIDYGDRVFIGVKFGKVFISLIIQYFITTSVLFNLTKVLTNILKSVTIASLITVLISTILTALILVVFGEYIPSVKVRNRKKDLSSFSVAAFYFLITIFKPATTLIYGISKSIIKIFKMEKNNLEPDVTEEDLLLIVGQGTKKGVFETSEHDMITNIFEFDDVLVEDIMTHRTDMAAVECNDSAAAAIKIAHESGYSRIPVYDDDLDNISGVLYAKDLLDLVGTEAGEKTPLKRYIRPAVHVPETNTAKDVFIELTEKKVQMAIVVDEYGGTSGIVTMEDLLEFIVGNIEDEYDNEENYDQIEHTGNNEYIASGFITITKLSEVLEASLPLDEEYDTLSGLLTTKLGYIPELNEKDVSITINNIKFTIIDNDDRKINKVRIQVLSKEMLEEAENKAE